MIKPFKGKETRTLFDGYRVSRWTNIERSAIRKLAMLNNAARLEDLRIPPANNLEKLKGDRQDSWSIRINDQFRICFVWENGHAFNVEIVDYH